MGDQGDMGNRNQGKPKAGLSAGAQRAKAGYEYLLAYKITVPIYDLTVAFCNRYLLPNSPYYPNLPHSPNRPYSRTHDQMVQAARSGMQNLAEGYKQQGMKGYIKLAGVSRGSLEELLKDYAAYARQHQLAIFPKEKAVGEIREIGKIWGIIRATPTLPDHPDFPNLPNHPEHAVNLMITLIHQANYLIDRLIISLKERHRTKGGLTEQLYQARKNYRGY